MTAALVLIGAPGSGKSTVLDALAAELEREGVAHGAIETEELTRGSRCSGTRFSPSSSAAPSPLSAVPAGVCS